MSRAYLVDERAGILVSDERGGLWLASTLDVLAPATDALKVRGAERGGPPADRSSVALAKASVIWPRWSEAANDRVAFDLTNPKVTAHPQGANIGVIALARVKGRGSEPGAQLEVPALAWDDVVANVRGGDHDGPGEGSGTVSLCCPQSVSGGEVWAVVRTAHLASDPAGGFAGAPGLVALDIRLDPTEAGAAVFSAGPSPRFLGLAQPLGPLLSVLVGAALIAQTVAHAAQLR